MLYSGESGNSEVKKDSEAIPPPPEPASAPEAKESSEPAPAVNETAKAEESANASTFDGQNQDASNQGNPNLGMQFQGMSDQNMQNQGQMSFPQFQGGQFNQDNQGMQQQMQQMQQQMQSGGMQNFGGYNQQNRMSSAPHNYVRPDPRTLPGSATNTGNIYIPPKDEGKMFVGGLNWETTDESLKNYFSQFGEVLDCTVMRDNVTGRSRGFGFLTFAESKSVTTVLAKEHFLDGKIVSIMLIGQAITF